jgi:4-carboxymuconolactone decarboxylase
MADGPHALLEHTSRWLLKHRSDNHLLLQESHVPVLSQEERIAAERRVREQLGLPMMSASPTRSVSTETIAVERDILGAQAFAFGEIWSRPGLDIRTRCFITLAALTAKYQLGPLASYVRASIKIGIAPSDILEAMLHVSSYAGLTAASEAMNVARREFSELGITQPVEEEITPTYPMNREDRIGAVQRIVREVGIGRHGLDPKAPPLQYLKSGVWTAKARDLPVENDFNQIGAEYGYGECWGRKALGYRIRSFITMAALQALLANDQLHFHMNNAVNLGITGDEIHEALAHVGIYAGVANWRNAANVARDIFLQRGIVQPA